MNEKRKTNFKCPLCDSVLVAVDGQVLDPKDGVTVWCENTHGQAPGNCPAQEVAGHGSNEKNAFEIIKDKYKKDKP